MLTLKKTDYQTIRQSTIQTYLYQEYHLIMTVGVYASNDTYPLAKEIKGGLEIRPTKSVQKGFRLAAKDGSGYFDCSDDAIMEMLMPYFRNLDFQ